jgi:hypothetical protein
MTPGIYKSALRAGFAEGVTGIPGLAKGFKRYGCVKLLRHLALCDGYEQATRATFADYLHSLTCPWTPPAWADGK